MKKIRYGILGMMILLAAGCYEINEDIVISDKGEGTYVTKMDMSAMIQMIQTMAGEDEMSKNGMDKAIDTTIRMNSVLDSSEKATPEQKRLYKDGTMRLQMNIKEGVLKADINFPFHSFSDLQALMSGSSTAGLDDVFKKVFSGGDSSQSAATGQDQGLDQINSIFDVTVTRGSIVRKVNDAKYKALMEKPEMAQAKQMVGNGFEVMVTTNIHLPRPVKKAENPFIKLSEDKRTVTIKYDLMKLLDTPEKFSYSITY